MLEVVINCLEASDSWDFAWYLYAILDLNCQESKTALIESVPFLSPEFLLVFLTVSYYRRLPLDTKVLLIVAEKSPWYVKVAVSRILISRSEDLRQCRTLLVRAKEELREYGPLDGSDSRRLRHVVRGIGFSWNERSANKLISKLIECAGSMEADGAVSCHRQ